jgi:hypothetical protein
MTKEQVLNGEAFTLLNIYDSSSSFRLDIEPKKEGNKLRGSLTKQHRMTTTLELIFEDYLYNIEKVGTKKVHLFTFMLGKKVTDTIRYEDMIPFAGSKPMTSAGK